MASVQSYIRAEASHGVFPTPQGAEAFSCICNCEWQRARSGNGEYSPSDVGSPDDIRSSWRRTTIALRGGHYATLPSSASVIETISSHASSHFSKLKNCNSKSGLLVPLILSIPADHTIDTEAIVIQIHIRYQNFPCSTRINPCRLGWHNFFKTSR